MIVAAADALLRSEPPHLVTLRRIATAAGISHGLITHYFGHQENVVRAVLEQRTKAAVAEVVERLGSLENGPDARSLMNIVLDFLLDPTRARIRAWLDTRSDPPAESGGQLAVLVDLATLNVNRVRAARGRSSVPRQTVSDVVTVLRAAARGFASGERSEDGDRRFRETLLSMVEGYFERLSGDAS